MAKTFSLPTDGKKLYRGDTIVFEAALSQGGVALDPTGYSIWFTAKTAVTQMDNQGIQKTIGSGIEVLDAATGKIRITLAPADTASLTADTTFQCDIQIKHIASGVITTVARGTIAITMDVTQAT